MGKINRKKAVNMDVDQLSHSVLERIKEQSGEGAPERFLRGELRLTDATPQKWTDENNAIRFSVTSHGRTLDGWFDFLTEKGREIHGKNEDILGGHYNEHLINFLKENFKPTKGITTEVVILKGSGFALPVDDLILSCLKTSRKFLMLSIEEALLIFEKFTQEEFDHMIGFFFSRVLIPTGDEGLDGNLVLVPDGEIITDYASARLKWPSEGIAFKVS